MGVFPIKVEGQRACDCEPLSEAVHRFRRDVLKIMTGVLNPFSYDPEAISTLGYSANVEVGERSEGLKRWMKR